MYFQHSREIWRDFPELVPGVLFCEGIGKNRVAARLVLIDGPTLARLMVDHNIGAQDRETYAIKRVDEDFFEDA